MAECHSSDETSMETCPNKTLKFAMMLGKLKALKRTGWVRCHVKDPESVAGHMYRMAALALLIDKDSGLDRDKCIRMALVHDMAECIVGDITPWDGISVEDKHQREKDAMGHLMSLVPRAVGQELLELWEEYDSASSAEARFVKDLDKYDMIVQAHQYEEQWDKPKALQQFFDSTQGKFKTEQVQKWVNGLYHERNIEEEKVPENGECSNSSAATAVEQFSVCDWADEASSTGVNSGNSSGGYTGGNPSQQNMSSKHQNKCLKNHCEPQACCEFPGKIHHEQNRVDLNQELGHSSACNSLTIPECGTDISKKIKLSE